MGSWADVIQGGDKQGDGRGWGGCEREEKVCGVILLIYLSFHCVGRYLLSSFSLYKRTLFSFLIYQRAGLLLFLNGLYLLI